MAKKHKVRIDPPSRGTKGWVEFFLYEFEWPVFTSSYELISARRSNLSSSRRPESMITPIKLGDPTKPAVEWYAPLRERPALFHTFADTPATQDGILEFARRFGMLGGSAAVNTDAGHPISVGSEGHVPNWKLEAEPLAEWTDRIFAMRQVIRLWEIASARQIDELQNVIVCTEGSIEYRPNPSWLRQDWRTQLTSRPFQHQPSRSNDAKIKSAESLVITRAPSALERWKRFGETEVVETALIAIEIIAERFLRRAISSRLIIDLDDCVPYLSQVPDDLGSALWLQFAKAIESGTRFRVCKTCGEWFALPLRGARLTREFCSDACRIKAYRNRQDQARALAADGKSPKEIARELDSTALVVRKWLRSKKGK